ncbi:hypothetical protein COZ71_02890 [Candidatus Desantisbacteria bacterium CG_4_8_14_3_um_filter_40_12]|uniref:DUF11 domain-containing protein n=1 Tax=Candidatus Desantisbacteria bacterium CG_4_8_14_3_um_filter_40_12 TaxID=1974545 RepID=A0A2M7JDN8_9BACT|nr:MAG: hypothetical protein COZ71_02890 [Candidatus Desantisbacteria bacterium CG_4_8_14_3_um_filter_40_12]
MMKKGMNWLLGIGALVCWMMLSVSQMANATSTTNLLITDTINRRVIEVNPITHNIVWQYGQTGVWGTGTNQLSCPYEATKLMNGNVLIADTENNHRVIEVQPTGTSGGTIVWQYGQTGVSGSGTNQLYCPNDVQKLDNGNVLIVDSNNHRVLEVQPTYPTGGSIVWQYNGTSSESLKEAERLVDGTTLICQGSRVMIVSSTGTTRWSYELTSPTDAKKLLNGNILIADNPQVIELQPIGTSGGTIPNRVIEVQPIGTSGGTIVWQYGTGTSGSGVNQLNYPFEAIRLANGNTMIADGNNYRVIEVRTTDYPSFTAGSIVWQQGQIGISGSGWNQLGVAVKDVEDMWLGILNQVRVEYKNMANVPQPVVTAWVFMPLIPALPPVLEVTKTVSPSGTQTTGTMLTYTIAYNNIGQGTAIDVAFTDAIPAGTVYGTGTAVIATGPTGTIAYSHDGISYNGVDSTPVTHIRWSIPTIGPGVSGTLQFSVTIK